jgi:hypothetical protein
MNSNTLAEHGVDDGRDGEGGRADAPGNDYDAYIYICILIFLLKRTSRTSTVSSTSEAGVVLHKWALQTLPVNPVFGQTLKTNSTVIFFFFLTNHILHQIVSTFRCTFYR